jgi:hypothetical protein
MANLHAQLPYGWRDGKLLSIEEAERGLACGCICPACRAPLVAKKGAKHAHHFAHYRGQSCAHGLETGLHLKAKEILERVRRIALPAVFLHRQETPYFPAQLIRFDQVQVEQRAGDLRPDLILHAGARRLLVEVAVTHAAPEQKIKRLQQLGLPALEIDVLAMYQQAIRQSGSFTAAYYEQALIHGLAHKRWLYNPKKQSAEYRLRKAAAARPVQHSIVKGYHRYIVPGCPLGKRFWRTGFREGKSYAQLWQDCLHCPRCLEISYRQELAGFRLAPQEPREVLCWGHLPLPQAPEWASCI